MTATSAVTNTAPARDAAAMTDAYNAAAIAAYAPALRSCFSAPATAIGSASSMNPAYWLWYTNGPRTNSLYSVGNSQNTRPSELYNWMQTTTLRATLK